MGTFSSTKFPIKITMLIILHICWKFSNIIFLFGPEQLIYQSKANGVVGGGLGWNDLLKSQHIYAEFSAYSCWFFIIVFSQYHKLKNCLKTILTLFAQATPHIILFSGTQGLHYVQIALGIHKFVKIPLRWLTKWTMTF